MPELPEVETDPARPRARGRRQADQDRRQVTGTRTVRRQTKKQFITRLEGAKITAVDRRGKYLVLKLDTGDLLVIHLRHERPAAEGPGPQDRAPKHTHVVITFTQGGQLRFVDPTHVRRAVRHRARTSSRRRCPSSPTSAWTRWTSRSPWVKFREMLLARTTKLKPLLMDQSFIAGIGNIYSDEILWEAGLRHDRTPQSLSTMEIRRLYRAIVEVLHEAVKHRGSTLGDQQYVDLHGRPGEYQVLHQAYDREGQACRRCRTTIVREKLGIRSTFYCPNCQI